MALDLLAPDRVRAQGIFDADAISEMLNVHLSRDGYFGHELWTLLSFQQWYSTFIEWTSPSPPAEFRPVVPVVAGR